MAKKKILVIAEGPADKTFIKKLFELYLGAEVYVVCFRTNIYQLYDSYESYRQPYENLDLQNVLLETMGHRLNSNDKKNLQDTGYSETILIFDFDPHDPKYSEEKILKLINHFSDSSDYGRLFINYPMLESFMHINKQCYEKGEKDPAFPSRTFEMKSLSHYKQDVGSEGFRFSIKPPANQADSLFKELRHKVSVVINQHLEKVAQVTEVELNEAISQETLYQLLERQCKNISNHQPAIGFVVNTSCLIIADLYPTIFEHSLENHCLGEEEFKKNK